MPRISKCLQQDCKVRMNEEETSRSCDKSEHLPYDGSCGIEIFGDLGYRRDESSGDKN